MEGECAGLGFTCVSPAEHAVRASHLSFAHEHAYPIMQAIIDRGVIGDFRQPNLMRFGFTPLYTRFVDCWDAVATIREAVQKEVWREARFQHRNLVT
jgi:kynureninase